MRIKTFAIVALLGLSGVASFAFAQGSVLNLDAVRSEQAQIHAAVEQRAGVYKDMAPASREQLLSKQAQLMGLIEGKQTTDELTPAQQIEVTRSLASITTLVSKADDERLVCERRAVLGSNRKERVCRTVAQIRQDQEAARNAMGGQDVCSSCKSN